MTHLTGKYLLLQVVLYFHNKLRCFVEECQKICTAYTNYCSIAVGVENLHKFWMCRQPRNVGQTSRQISTTASIGDTSLTHVMRVAAHSITSPTPTAMGQ
jgi:hypothetical protein